MLSTRNIFGLIGLCFMIRYTCGLEKCTAAITGACPPAWIQWGDNCYKHSGENLPWAEAKQKCITMGSVLVIPQSQEETQFLVENLIYWFWIDCNDLQSEGAWVCQDGTTDVEYRNWKTGEPTDSWGGEDCAATDKSGWNDIPCDILQPFICKQPAPQLHF